MSTKWLTRAENGADFTTVREITIAAFPTAQEADIVDALRTDPGWIDGLSVVATDGADRVVAHALLTRCHVGDAPSLMLGPVSVLPEFQRQGAGNAVTQAALDEARRQGEPHVVVVGWPEYYPRFGLERASTYGIKLSIDAPDEAVMVLSLETSHPLPSGVVRFAAGFGLERFARIDPAAVCASARGSEVTADPRGRRGPVNPSRCREGKPRPTFCQVHPGDTFAACSCAAVERLFRCWFRSSRSWRLSARCPRAREGASP